MNSLTNTCNNVFAIDRNCFDLQQRFKRKRLTLQRKAPPASPPHTLCNFLLFGGSNDNSPSKTPCYRVTQRRYRVTLSHSDMTDSCARPPLSHFNLRRRKSPDFLLVACATMAAVRRWASAPRRGLPLRSVRRHFKATRVVIVSSEAHSASETRWFHQVAQVAWGFPSDQQSFQFSLISGV